MWAKLFKPFHATDLFLYPLINIRKEVFWCFWGCFWGCFFHELCYLKSGQLSSSLSTKLYTVSTKMSYKLIRLYENSCHVLEKHSKWCFQDYQFQRMNPLNLCIKIRHKNYVLLTFWRLLSNLFNLLCNRYFRALELSIASELKNKTFRPICTWNS